MTVGPSGEAYGPEGCVVEQMNYAEELDHVDMLREKLMHRDPTRRHKAAVAMASYVGDQVLLPQPLDPHPAAILVKGMMKPRTQKPQLLEGLRAFGIMGVHCADYTGGCLAALVNHQDNEVRFEAMRAIRSVGPQVAEVVAPELAAAVVDVDTTSPLLRFQAARSLEVMGPPAAAAAAEALSRSVNDKDPDVQLASCRALVAMGEPASVAAPALVEIISRNSGYELRRVACDALTSMGPGAAVAATELGRILRPKYGDDPVLRQKAATALAAIGVNEVRKPERQLQLAKALGDKSPDVAKAAREALRNASCKRALNGSMALFEKAPEDRPKNAPPADDPSPEVAPAAVAEPVEGEHGAHTDLVDAAKDSAMGPAENAPEAEAAEPNAATTEDQPGAQPEATADEAHEGEGEASERPAEAEPMRPLPSTFQTLLSEAEARTAKQKGDQVRLESENVLERLGLDGEAVAAGITEAAGCHAEVR
mmetsp:Transcript_120274/g.345800  ORF Transcript_120274/g.345800 Transcript_120274/m.345800 type:complete len:481 (+) Transcript_120274:164-1606(+)